MQNTENEKLTWEAPRLIIQDLNSTESGDYYNSAYAEGAHFTGSYVADIS